jgi:hypothetical protein
MRKLRSVIWKQLKRGTVWLSQSRAGEVIGALDERIAATWPTTEASGLGTSAFSMLPDGRNKSG